MNEKIRRQINVNNPFVFKHISNLKGRSMQSSKASRLWLLKDGLKTIVSFLKGLKKYVVVFSIWLCNTHDPFKVTWPEKNLFCPKIFFLNVQKPVNVVALISCIYSFAGIDHFDDIGPCVILASPGMMQSGLSRLVVVTYSWPSVCDKNTRESGHLYIIDDRFCLLAPFPDFCSALLALLLTHSLT